MPVQRFALDAAIVFGDLMSPVAALGVEVKFAPGPVVERPLRDMESVRRLLRPEPEEIGAQVVQTVRQVDAELAGRIPVLGFAGGPWSIAAYLVQGEGKREFPALRAMASAAPEVLEELMARLAVLCGDYLVQQARAGAAAVQVFETWSGLLSRPDWERVVKPHLRTLLERAASAGVPRILYLKHSSHLIDAALDLPFEALSVDWRIDLPRLQKRMGPGRAVQGNLDPAVLLAGPERTRQEARLLLERTSATGHVFNLGHGLLPETPLESVEALIEEVHAVTDGKPMDGPSTARTEEFADV
jgi:uroporphyrinogen decarboxylase